MTCLTVTVESVSEAIERQVDMVIAHHPLPFKPLSKITTQTQTGNLIWRLAKAGISVYSPHTSWDSAERGINALLASRLQLGDVRPLIPSLNPELESLGAGRFGELSPAVDLQQFVAKICKVVPYCRPHGVDCGRDAYARIAIACGSGGSLLAAATQNHCELFLTGEATFHSSLEAQTSGISLVMIGHFASERFAMESLAADLQTAYPTIEVWPSKFEKDPVRNFA